MGQGESQSPDSSRGETGSASQRVESWRIQRGKELISGIFAQDANFDANSLILSSLHNSEHAGVDLNFYILLLLHQWPQRFLLIQPMNNKCLSKHFIYVSTDNRLTVLHHFIQGTWASTDFGIHEPVPCGCRGRTGYVHVTPLEQHRG